MSDAQEIRFPPFHLDPSDERLWHGARNIPLAPKAFAVLRHLARHHGRLVTKEELLDAVWPSVHVGEAVLKVCVREIRQAIDDPARAPRFIQTVHGRGYRFIAAIADSPESRRPSGNGSGQRVPERPARVSRYFRVDAGSSGARRLVGRASVLDRFQMWLEAAWRGTRQVIFVIGEPGIGKTAVVEAFLERAAADQRVWIAQGQCAEGYGSREPYLPVLDALGRLCRETEPGWLIALLREQAPTWLMQMPWLLEAEDRDALRRDVLGATQERLLREMAEAVEALAAEAPLVLVVEDLHWSDAATLDLLSLLARRQEPARLLVIGTARSDAVSSHPIEMMRRDLQAHGHCQELWLQLLSEAAVADYLRERFPGSRFPPSLARVIHQRTEGNPLFMTSVVDDLTTRGLLTGSEDRWELRAAPEMVEGDVPEDVRQMIERQLSRLDADDQRFLEAGSVADMEFSAAAVAAALDERPESVEARCDALAQRQLFIRSLGQREWPDGTVAARYRFAHALHRSTLYQRIPPVRRRALHQAIGEREEAAHGERAREIAPGLAVHFERGGDHQRAVRYLQHAADIAMARHANREAAESLRRALAIARRLPDADGVALRIELLEQLGLARRSMGDVPGTVQTFDDLAALARAHGRREEEVRGLLYQSSALSWIDRTRSLAAVEQAVALSQDVADEALRGHVRGYCGVLRILSHGWRDDDAAACRAAIEATRAVGDRRLLSLHVGHLAHLESHQSEYRAAVRTADEALRLAHEATDVYQHMTCQFHRAWALLHLGEWGATQRTLMDGLQMAERNGHHLWARAFRLQMAWLHSHACDYAGARALCAEALEPVQEAQLGALFGSIVLGFAYLGSRQHAPARAAFDAVAERCAGGPVPMDWILQMPLRLGMSELWLDRRAFGRAREQAEALRRLAAMSRERTYLALGHRGLAEAALGEGDGLAAEHEVGEALQIVEAHEVPLAEWKVYATAARIEQARGQDAQAKAYWTRSAAVLERLAVSLDADPALARSFREHPVVRKILRARQRTIG